MKLRPVSEGTTESKKKASWCSGKSQYIVLSTEKEFVLWQGNKLKHFEANYLRWGKLDLLQQGKSSRQ